MTPPGEMVAARNEDAASIDLDSIFTAFDRAARHLCVESVHSLQMDEPVLADAAQWLGI